MTSEMIESDAWGNLDDSWKNIAVLEPQVEYKKGKYKGLVIEVGPWDTPVSHTVALHNPDIFVLCVEPAVRYPEFVVPAIAKTTEVKKLPPNFRYTHKRISGIKIPKELPILGLYSFFPSGYERFGFEVGKFIKHHFNKGHVFPCLIITETSPGGGISEFQKGFERQLQGFNQIVYENFVSFQMYRSKYPSTRYHVLFDQGMNQSTGFISLEIKPEGTINLIEELKG